MAEIANVSKAQASGIDHVNSAVSRIDSITQAFASNTQWSVSVAEDLDHRAKEVMLVVRELEKFSAGSTDG